MNAVCISASISLRMPENNKVKIDTVPTPSSTAPCAIPKDFQNAGQPSAPPASSTHLKARLKEFWNSQEADRDLSLDAATAGMPFRERASSFIPHGSRILDVACGT